MPFAPWGKTARSRCNPVVEGATISGSAVQRAPRHLRVGRGVVGMAENYHGRRAGQPLKPGHVGPVRARQNVWNAVWNAANYIMISTSSGAQGGAAPGRQASQTCRILGARVSQTGLASPLVWRANPGPRKLRKGASQTPGASRRSIPLGTEKGQRRTRRRSKQYGRRSVGYLLSCPRRRASSNRRSLSNIYSVCDYWIIRFRG